ncbi:hypothetical protein AWQ21_07565 [Picosynechococcus sp. PCC 7003]|uniref:hypothetical protein n=1 Tax=Picosynechococcus sp. PCC 7003 TaxID=374981 RepID=UPI000810EFE5|nr:hypothetical protein [Picosynechococcus sp. PCC 7003]ANV84252.1 hypothetical protein AWQ21_07565 [Picosynechococcus sp. PCC 7003]
MTQGFSYTPTTTDIPVVFQDSFVNATISATQAWSLFFTGGTSEGQLGKKRVTGWLWNYFLFGVIFASIAEITIFNGF